MLYVIIFFSILPLVLWKMGDARKDRHQMLAGLVFDKFEGLKRFDDACLSVYGQNQDELSKEKFDEVAESWKKSFRIEAGQYLQAKYTSPQLSKILGSIKNSQGLELDNSVPGFASHIEQVAEQNARNIVLRLKPNSKADTQVMGRRRRRR